MPTSSDIRNDLTRLLRLDLVGPGPGDPNVAEALPEPPSRWYLTGFLVPAGAPAEVASDLDTDDLDAAPEKPGVEDGSAPDQGPKKKAFFPSSIGLSFLVPRETTSLDVTVQWGDYSGPPDGEPEEGDGDETDEQTSVTNHRRGWQRIQRVEALTLDLRGTKASSHNKIQGGSGLELFCTQRPVPDRQRHMHPLPEGTRSVSVFLVNRRPAGLTRDFNTVFQAGLAVRSSIGFVARPDMRGADGDQMDERVGALQYREVAEYAVGHNVATHVTSSGGQCQEIASTWIPSHDVARVVATAVPGVTVSMQALAEAADPQQLQAMLVGLPQAYLAAKQNQATSAGQKPATWLSACHLGDGAVG